MFSEVTSILKNNKIVSTGFTIKGFSIKLEKREGRFYDSNPSKELFEKYSAIVPLKGFRRKRKCSKKGAFI
ncbi:MAG TPA: hypothetical protein VK559_09875 [Ferruginibacter sp.]|nr:hypothetical protein [Ferruginibacter sp.]